MSERRRARLPLMEQVLGTMLVARRILGDRIGPSGRRVFVCLSIHPRLSIGELAKCIEVTDSIASRAVSVLVAQGLARVSTDPRERRRHLVELTPMGERTADTFESEVSRYFKNVT